VREAVVVGGGPAGAALALRLARADREVLLVEREAGPHNKVCGEFLSEGAAAALGQLGLDPEALGAHPIDRVRLVRGCRTAERLLPFRALSLSRRTLDEALLARAAAEGAEILRGIRVTAAEREAGGWRLRTTGAPIETRQIFLATGKHDLRDRHRPPGLHGDLLGFKQHWRLASSALDALTGVVELHLFAGGYAGLERVEGGIANLCLVVRRRAFTDWPRLLERLQRTSLRDRLEGGEPLWEKPLAVSALPYGHVQRRSEGPWRLGDQAAVIPSFAGEGMAIAFLSAERAAEAYLAGHEAGAYQAALARKIGGRVTAASVLSHALVHGWSQRLAIGAAALNPDLLATVAGAARI
jgi:flavin-dependent dehydrogenase